MFLSPLRYPLLSLSSCPDGHLLRLTLGTCEANPLWAAGFTDGEFYGKHPILELRLYTVGIDRPGKGNRPFKRARDDFLREPVVSIPVTAPSPLLRLGLALLRLLPRALRLVLVLVLMAVLPANRQGVLINRQLNIFWSHPWEGHIYLVASGRLTDVHG